MEDDSQETEMTAVLRGRPNRESDDPRLTVQLEDAEGREWDPMESDSPMTGLLPAGWARDSALTFKRTIEER